MVTAPGDRVKVHVPVAGKPFNITFPVSTLHVGCVIVPTIGADGVAACALTSTLAEAGEIHPEALVTVKV